MIVTSCSGAPIGSDLGAAELTRLGPNAVRVFGPDPGEQAVVVIDGSAQVVDDALNSDVGPGAVVLVGAGRAVAVRALGAPVTVFSLRATVPPGVGTPTRIIAAPDGDGEAVHAPERGFFRMTAQMIVNGPSGGHRAFTIGMSTFAQGEGCHDLHRHVHAEELFLVWEGEGTHLSADSAALPLTAGDLTWVARNEFHGFRNSGAGVARAVFCYLGVDDRVNAGYEVLPTHIQP